MQLANQEAHRLDHQCIGTEHESEGSCESIIARAHFLFMRNQRKRREYPIILGTTLSALAVTTPGAAAGWVDTVEKFGSGKLSLEQILTPAIELGEEGFPVSELSAMLVCLSSHLPPLRFNS